jgi:hypothetical protein
MIEWRTVVGASLLRASSVTSANVANRNLAKAAQTIDAPQLQPPTAAVIAELERLHPPADPSMCPPTEAAPVQISAARLRGVLRTLPKGKAGGTSGWTYEHVRAAADTSAAAFEALPYAPQASCKLSAARQPKRS